MAWVRVLVRRHSSLSERGDIPIERGLLVRRDNRADEFLIFDTHPVPPHHQPDVADRSGTVHRFQIGDIARTQAVEHHALIGLERERSRLPNPTIDRQLAGSLSGLLRAPQHRKSTDTRLWHNSNEQIE